MSDSPPEPGAPLPTEPTPAPRAQQWRWLPIAAQTGLVAVLAAWLACGLPLGIPGQWAWETHPKPLPLAGLIRALILGLGIVGVCWLGLWRLGRRKRPHAGTLAGLVALVVALQLSIASLAPQAGLNLVAGTASSVATEYFTVASTVRDPWAYCRTYADSERGGHHVATHPPGAVLAYWLCLRVYGSRLFPSKAFDTLVEHVVGTPRWQIAVTASSCPWTTLGADEVGPALFCCVVFGVCGALAMLPLYWLASRASGRSTALVVCCLFALAPAPVLFFQGLDALLLLLATGGLALAYAAVVRRSPWAGALCGLTLGLMSAITFGATAALATAAVLAVLLLRRLPATDRPRAWVAIAAAGGTWLATILALHLACGSKLPVIFAQAMAAHRQLTWEGMGRHYAPWVGLNLVEFFVFLGLPAAVAVAAALGDALCRRGRGLPPVALIGLVGLVVLLLLDLSGSVRGEVARVWLFLMPPLILWAGWWVRRTLRDAPAVAVTSLALSVAQVVLLGWTLTPVVLPY